MQALGDVVRPPVGGAVGRAATLEATWWTCVQRAATWLARHAYQEYRRGASLPLLALIYLVAAVVVLLVHATRKHWANLYYSCPLRCDQLPRWTHACDILRCARAPRYFEPPISSDRRDAATLAERAVAARVRNRCVLTFWGMTHLLLYTVIGFVAPGTWLVAYLVGLVYECVIERANRVNCPFDLIWNAVGLVVGIALRKAIDPTVPLVPWPFSTAGVQKAMGASFRSTGAPAVAYDSPCSPAH